MQTCKLTDQKDHDTEGFGCPVAIQVKLCDSPTIITAVWGGVTILGVSEKRSNIGNII